MYVDNIVWYDTQNSNKIEWIHSQLAQYLCKSSSHWVLTVLVRADIYGHI